MEVNGQLHALVISLLEKQHSVLWRAGWAPQLVWMLWRREESHPPVEDFPLIITNPCLLDIRPFSSELP
jgi:hypothetical protein